MKKKRKEEFYSKIREKLDEIESLDELNMEQKYLRQQILRQVSDTKEEYEKYDKKYNIEKTKELFYNFLEPIEQNFLEKILGDLGSFFMYLKEIIDNIKIISKAKRKVRKNIYNNENKENKEDAENLEEIIKNLKRVGSIKEIDEEGRLIIPPIYILRAFYLVHKVFIYNIGEYLVLSLNDFENRGEIIEIDKLSRIRLGKILWDCKENEKIGIWEVNNYIILTKLSDKCYLCRSKENLVKYKELLVCKKCFEKLKNAE
ncbi:MAG: hypothetical protein HFJ50_04395 [Clostridia bacterium]|jgi:hypothetical protein|nr:hypothetical protein [Clostridia bacterium]